MTEQRVVENKEAIGEKSGIQDFWRCAKEKEEASVVRSQKNNLEI